MKDATLCDVIINWFELTYGYNPDPSLTADGEILRWALQRRQLQCRRHGEAEAPRLSAIRSHPMEPGEPEYHH